MRDQWFPALAAAPDGRLTALWLDRRDDPANRLYYAYARTSTDGGLTWRPGTRVSSAPSDPNLNIPPGTEGIGDYIGLAAGPGVVWGAWVDVRNGNQDIYAAREQFTPSPCPPPRPTPAHRPAPATPRPRRSPTVTPCPLQFTDVPPSSPFYPYIRCLACRGIIGGYPCGGPGEPCPGTYYPPRHQRHPRPGRQDRRRRRRASAEPVPSTQQTFEDVPPASTFWLWIERLAGRGIIGGYPCGGPGEPCVAPANRPYFRPNNDVTRGQLAKIVAGAAGYTETPTGADLRGRAARQPLLSLHRADRRPGHHRRLSLRRPRRTVRPPRQPPLFPPEQPGHARPDGENRRRNLPRSGAPERIEYRTDYEALGVGARCPGGRNIGH